MMQSFLSWLDLRTGLPAAVRAWLDRPVAGGRRGASCGRRPSPSPWPRSASPGCSCGCTIAPPRKLPGKACTTFQRHVPGGWLLRAIHYYTAQTLLALVALYLLQMIVRGSTAPARSAVLDRARPGTPHAGPEPHRRPASLGSERLLVHAHPHRLSAATAGRRRRTATAGDRRAGLRTSHPHAVPGPARGAVRAAGPAAGGVACQGRPAARIGSHGRGPAV